jgi:hypothetical protein
MEINVKRVKVTGYLNPEDFDDDGTIIDLSHPMGITTEAFENTQKIDFNRYLTDIEFEKVDDE